MISAAPPPVNTWGAPTCMWAAAYNTPMVWRGLVVSGVCLLLHSAHQQTLRQPTQVVTAVPAWAFLQKGPAVLSLSQPCHAAPPCACGQHQPAPAARCGSSCHTGLFCAYNAASISQALLVLSLSLTGLRHACSVVQPASVRLCPLTVSQALPFSATMCLQCSQHRPRFGAHDGLQLCLTVLPCACSAASTAGNPPPAGKAALPCLTLCLTDLLCACSAASTAGTSSSGRSSAATPTSVLPIAMADSGQDPLRWASLHAHSLQVYMARAALLSATLYRWQELFV